MTKKTGIFKNPMRATTLLLGPNIPRYSRSNYIRSTFFHAGSYLKFQTLLLRRFFSGPFSTAISDDVALCTGSDLDLFRHIYKRKISREGLGMILRTARLCLDSVIFITNRYVSERAQACHCYERGKIMGDRVKGI